MSEKIVKLDKNSWKQIFKSDQQKDIDNVEQHQQNEQDIPTKPAIITTLALAALPEDDNKINESCMPFTAFSGLLAIYQDGLKGTDIVANIGQALIDADCNYKVDGEARWTNSRTTASAQAVRELKT